jgi:hypothetical protein
MAIMGKLRSSEERLRKPASANAPSGAKNASVTPSGPRSNRLASYGFGTEGGTVSAMDTVTLAVPELDRFTALGLKVHEV